MATKNYVQIPTAYLSGSGVIIGATTITINSFTDIYGNNLTMADFGDKGYATVEPDTTNEESFIFTSVTTNANGTVTLGGIATTLAKSPYTETSGLIRAHVGGSKVVVSDTVAFWNTFANKANDETITGRWGSATVPSAANDYANKAYVDGIAIAGAPDSSTTVKGIGKVSVAPASPTSPIFVGDNDGRVPTQAENDAMVGNNTDVAVGTGNKYVTQTGLQHNAEKYAADTSGSSTAYVVTFSPVPTSYTTGMVFHVKIVNANTTTTPTINFNALGAKTIVKGTSTALVVGDILANQFITLVYDGTNMVLQNPVSTNAGINPIYKNGTTTYGLTTASGSQTIAHGLGITPTKVRLTVFNGNGTTSGNTNITTSIGSYDSGSQHCIYSIILTGGGQAVNVAAKGIHIIGDASTGDTAYQEAVVSVDATNITLTWTKTNSPSGTANIFWEANS